MDNVIVFDTVFAVTILAIIAIVVPLALLFANWLLHPGRTFPSNTKASVYECGIAHVSGTASERYPVKYYMVTMLFLVFDLEVAFLYPWSVQFLKADSWAPLYVLLAFLVILEAGYMYIYRKGVLNWYSLKD